jgi:hypothetical protein
MEEYDVPLAELAERMLVAKPAARRFALQNGFKPMLRQHRKLGHYQRVLTWSRAQLAEMLAKRKAAGFEVREDA